MYRQAFKQAGRAYYKYSDLDDRIKELERKHIPETVRRNGGVIVFLTRAIIERRVEVKWRY